MTDAENPRAADIAVLEARKEALRAAGTLTPELEADIDAHLTNLRTNVQNGPVPLGGRPVEADHAQGPVAVELAQGHRDRAAEAGAKALQALRAIREELASAPAANTVATMRSCLAFCLTRIEHELATAARS